MNGRCGIGHGGIIGRNAGLDLLRNLQSFAAAIQVGEDQGVSEIIFGDMRIGRELNRRDFPAVVRCAAIDHQG